MRSSVVLPEPDGPSSATSSPALMSSDTPCSAGVAPKVLTTFSTFTCIGLSHRAVQRAAMRRRPQIHIICYPGVHVCLSPSVAA